MREQDPDALPFNRLPPVVVALVLVMAGIELVFQAGRLGLVGGPGAIGWRLAAVQTYGFLDPVFDWMRANGIYPPEQMLRFVTYPFIHASFTHAVFTIVFLLAIGKVVGEVFNAVAVLGVFFAASILGALAYGFLSHTRIPLIGAYPGDYGLIGAFTYLIWARLTVLGENRYRAFSLIGFLLAIQLIFALLIGGSPEWIADTAGFAAGFVLSFIVRPGGWEALLARLRKR